MGEKLRAGEAAEWNSHGGIAKGKAGRKLTSRTTLKGHQVDRFADEPTAAGADATDTAPPPTQQGPQLTDKT